MSFARLLQAGRSLESLGDGSRYRMVGQGPMPKFGPRPNPFKSTAPQTRPAARPQGAALPTAAANLPLLVKPTATTSMAPAATITATPPTTVAARPQVEAKAPVAQPRQKAPQAPTAKRGVWGWVRVVASWFSWRLESSTPSVPKFSSEPAQPEFKLEEVKVVRNDLSDADLEVVTGNNAPRKAKSPAEGGI